MRRSIVWVLGLALLSAGCAVTPDEDEPKMVKEPATDAQAPAGEPADEPADEQPADSASDVTGTTWTVTYYDAATSQEYVHDVTFLPGGEMFDEHPNNATFDNDNWEQVGSTVIMYFNDGYATYTGELSAPGVLSGTATNINASTWPWTAVLKS